MKLELALPPDADLVWEVSPIRPRVIVRPDAVLASHVPTGAQLLASAPVSLTTMTGWPLVVRDATVVVDGGVVEARLVANYQLLRYAATILVRSMDAARFAERHATIVEVLCAARPRFRDDTAAVLSELWHL